MPTASSLISAIRSLEPQLTNLVAETRPDADRKSLKVAVVGSLGTASLAVLNIVSHGNPDRSECDALVAALPSLVGQDSVIVDQVISDPELAGQARARIQGANRTNAPTALALAHEICGMKDFTRMLALDKGPMGPIGGVAAVLSQRLVGDEQAANLMLPTLEIVSKLVAAINKPVRLPRSASNTPSQATGCIFGATAILVGAAGTLGGLVAVAWQLF